MRKIPAALNKSLKTPNNSRNLKYLVIVLTISIASGWDPIWSCLIKDKMYWHDSIQNWRKTCRHDMTVSLTYSNLSEDSLKVLNFCFCMHFHSVCDIEVCSGAICAQFWPQAKEVSSIPYTCMCGMRKQSELPSCMFPAQAGQRTLFVSGLILWACPFCSPFLCYASCIFCSFCWQFSRLKWPSVVKCFLV